MSLELGAQQVVDRVAVFLEAWVHQIIYLRGLYSSELFERNKLFGIAVHKSRHPQLNSYISDLIDSLRNAIASREVEKLVVVIFDPSDRVVERFVVTLNLLTAPEGHSFSAVALDRSLKDCLLKLQFSDAALPPLPGGCRFEIAAYSSNPDTSAGLWVQEPTAGLELSRPELVPIKSTHLQGGTLSLQLHVEAPLTSEQA
mmetsp:Transcript_19289/g.53779  ORF Transcript_19289/g.53779 Transcript_19289/m.53779 type:complete len:200 (+) Transcript_19289:93-692(+)